MTTQLETLSASPFFTSLADDSLVDVNFGDLDCDTRSDWQREASLEMLAHEIVLYMPALAEGLAAAGREKLAA
jgi:hypothetical protein